MRKSLLNSVTYAASKRIVCLAGNVRNRRRYGLSPILRRHFAVS